MSGLQQLGATQGNHATTSSLNKVAQASNQMAATEETTLLAKTILADVSSAGFTDSLYGITRKEVITSCLYKIDPSEKRKAACCCTVFCCCVVGVAPVATAWILSCMQVISLETCLFSSLPAVIGGGISSGCCWLVEDFVSEGYAREIGRHIRSCKKGEDVDTHVEALLTEDEGGKKLTAAWKYAAAKKEYLMAIRNARMHLHLGTDMAKVKKDLLDFFQVTIITSQPQKVESVNK